MFFFLFLDLVVCTTTEVTDSDFFTKLFSSCNCFRGNFLSSKIVCNQNDYLSKQWESALKSKTLYDICLGNKYSYFNSYKMYCFCIIKHTRDESVLSAFLHFFSFRVCFVWHTCKTSMLIWCEETLWRCSLKSRIFFFDCFNIMRRLFCLVILRWVVGRRAFLEHFILA